VTDLAPDLQLAALTNLGLMYAQGHGVEQDFARALDCYRQAAESGMIGIAFTHSDSFVAPHGGTRAFFGTNPTCSHIGQTTFSNRPFSGFAVACIA
jgi:LDH2 family malate/lactate/ureidoglycolate dehydrogenase